MENLKLIDEIDEVEEVEEKREVFEITSLSGADWCFERLKAVKKTKRWACRIRWWTNSKVWEFQGRNN